MENEKQISVRENMQISIPQNEALQLYASASKLQLSESENKALLELFPEEEIEIRPDGHIYLPQSYYRNRLNQSLGIGQWSLVVKGSTQETSENGEKIKMLLNGALVIRGCFVAEAVGEAELHLTNQNQSLGTVWEAAKSDCITRCCKDLSIGQQIYQPTYVREWQKKNAIQVWIKDKKKPYWRKKSSPPYFDELGPVDPAKPFPFQHPKKQLPWLNKTTKAGGITPEWIEVTKAIAEGALTMETFDQLEDKFKVSAAIKSELISMINAGSKSEEKSGVNSDHPIERIPGEVYAKLEKCKTKAEVDQLAVAYKEKIMENQNWRDVFMDRKKSIHADKHDQQTKAKS